MTLFPIFVELRARKCVVVGAGKVAAAKAAGLLSHGARVHVIAPRAMEWVRAQARAGKLTWRRREFDAGDVNDAFLVVAATNSRSTNEAVFRVCKASGVLCNVVDDPQHCDFFYPAVVRSGVLQIAISTSGRSPALARRLRMELERQFGPEYGAWIEHVGKARRQLFSRRLPADERRRLVEDISSQKSFEEFLRKRRPAKTASKKSRAGGQNAP